jgi:hypothetical protein
MNQWWSWGLSAIGIAGIFLAGSSKKVGWLLGFGVQGLWIAYAVATHQWGFIASALAYASVYGRNWLRWRRAEQAAEAAGRVTA